MTKEAKWRVGVVSGEYKLLIEDCGYKGKHKNRMFRWKCLNCSAEHGPSYINHINRTLRPNCCMRSRKYGSDTHGSKNIPSQYMVSLKRSAISRGLLFEVDADYLEKLLCSQDFRCAYTGKFLGIGRGKNGSVDRINNSLGYVKGNVQWVDIKVNMMKHIMSHEEFIELCSLVASRRKE